CARVSLGFDYW
nr:immunoglobulin heavy chain junction region [Macaca mulatta]MOW97558.1 immunoglobulin heavy chain junction region [Macaca mulatta]